MSALERAEAAWGAVMPEWVRVLAEACDAGGQRETALAIGYSQAVVSQVLSRSYAGDYAAVEAAVSGALMGETVRCPVFGELRRDQCLRNQRLPKGPTGDPARRALRRTCPTCPNALGGKR